MGKNTKMSKGSKDPALLDFEVAKLSLRRINSRFIIFYYIYYLIEDLY